MNIEMKKNSKTKKLADRMKMNLTDAEFVRSVENDYSLISNPDIFRLCRIVNQYEDLVIDLKKFTGLDDDWTIDGESVSDYIHRQGSELLRMEEEIGELNDKLDKLAARSVAQLISILESKLGDEKELTHRLRSEVEASRKREDEANHKLKFWNVLAVDDNRKEANK